MVEVFKTNIENENEADRILRVLQAAFPSYKINFDLDDCDNILRMETQIGVLHEKLVIDLIKNHGFEIEVLPDIPIAKTAIAR